MTKEKKTKKESFEDYVKEHGEEEDVPFDDVLRRAVKKPPTKSKKQEKLDD